MDPIAPIGSATAASSLTRAAPVAAPGGTGFASALSEALDKVSTLQSDSERLAKEVQLDNPEVSIEESVIAMQKASLAFQAVVQVRNRLVQSYHDIMNMQV